MPATERLSPLCDKEDLRDERRQMKREGLDEDKMGQVVIVTTSRLVSHCFVVAINLVEGLDNSR